MNKYLREIWPLVLLFGLLIIFFFPILFLGQTFFGSGLIYSDLMTFNFPLKFLLAESLREGTLPFWTSLIGNGVPVFAESQIGALYLPHLILFRLLPVVLAFNLNLFLHFLLASFGTYIFCRVSLKIGWVGAVMASLSFALSGFMISRIHQTNIVLVVSWLPWILLLLEQTATKQRLIFTFLLALVLTQAILAGHIEMFYYSFFGGGIFFLLLLFFQKEKIKPLLLLLLSLFLALGLSAPQILSTQEMLSFSERSGGLSFESASREIWPLSTFRLFLDPRADFFQSAPDYKPSDPVTYSGQELYGYIGIVPLLLAFLSFTFWRKKMVLVFILILVLTLLLALGRSTQVFAILWEIIPGLKFFRFPTKWFFFIEFSLAVLAAFGAERMIEKVKNVKMVGNLRVLRVVGIGVVLVVFADLYFNNLPKQPTISSDFWFNKPPVVEVVKNGLENGNYRLYSHGTNNIEYGTAKDQVLQKQFLNILPPNTNIPYNLGANREWTAIFLSRQQKFARLNTTLDPETGVLRLSSQLKRSLDLQAVKYLLSDLPFEDSDLVKVAEFPLDKKAFHYAYLMVNGQMQNVQIPIDRTYVYENKGVLPRASWVGKSRIMAGQDSEPVFSAVLGENFNPDKEVILDEPLGKLDKLDQLDSKGTARIIEDTGNEVKIKVESEKEGFLVLSDTFYPGWKAEVDGKEIKIYRANFNFRAVEVPKGGYEVVFSFEPTYWRMGVWISITSLIVTLFGIAYAVVNKRK